jgi:hypothetical protein
MFVSMYPKSGLIYPVFTKLGIHIVPVDVTTVPFFLLLLLLLLLFLTLKYINMGNTNLGGCSNTSVT